MIELGVADLVQQGKLSAVLTDMPHVIVDSLHGGRPAEPVGGLERKTRIVGNNAMHGRTTSGLEPNNRQQRPFQVGWLR